MRLLLLLAARAVLAGCTGQLAPLAPTAVVVRLFFCSSALISVELLAGALHYTILGSEAVADLLGRVVVGDAVAVVAVAELVVGTCLCGDGHEDDGEG